MSDTTAGRRVPPPSRWSALAPTLLAIAAAALVFRGALGLFFAQDDFAGLARAGGLLPRLEGPWRYLSGQTYFDVMRALAGLEARAYHAASLLAHLACVALLLALLLRRLSLPAAWIGAVFFAVHPSLFTALYSVSGIGEILALTFGLATLIAASWIGPVRWLAVPLFTLSLISKESTILLPGVIALQRLLSPRPERRSPAARPSGGAPRNKLSDPQLVALAGLSIVYLTTFLIGDAFSIRRALPADAPYSLAFDSTLWRNLLSYVGWTVNFSILTVRAFSDSVDPKVFPHAIAGLIAWLAGLRFRTLRERGWVIGGALYLGLLLPVLPLRNHTYHYYLYAPLCGAAWCVAALTDVGLAAIAGRRTAGARSRGPGADAGTRPGATAWTLAAVLAAALTLNGALLVRKIESYPFVHPALRADPTVDRARIARNVHRDLAAAALPHGARLRFWSPAAIAMERDAGRDPTQETYWERNVRGALQDGLGVRVLFPEVSEVEFVRAFEAPGDSALYALYAIDGRVRVVSRAELDSILRSHSHSGSP